jgi:hypothetical protein
VKRGCFTHFRHRRRSGDASVRHVVDEIAKHSSGTEVDCFPYHIRQVRIFPNAGACLRLVRALAVGTHENWIEAMQKKEALRKLGDAA